MQWQEIADNWPGMLDAARTRWPSVSEEDLIALTPTQGELSTLVAEREGLARDEAERQVAEWTNGPMPADSYADPSHDLAAGRDAGRYVPDGEDALSDDRRFGDDDAAEPPVGRD